MWSRTIVQAGVLLGSVVLAGLLGVRTLRHARPPVRRGRAWGRLALAAGLVAALGCAWRVWGVGILVSMQETWWTTQDLRVVNVDDSAEVSLTHHPALYTQPVWSPDGTRIAVLVGGRAGHELHVVNAGGNGSVRLSDGASGSAPAWSLDGSRLAFGSGKSRWSTKLCVVRADGTGKAFLTDGDRDDYPVWSPDARYVAFARSFTWYVVDSAGGAPREVGAPQQMALMLVGTQGGSPWSPDGRFVVAAAQGLVCVADVEGGRTAQLQLGGSGASVGALPLWHPDGRRLAWCSTTRPAPTKSQPMPPLNSQIHLFDRTTIDWSQARPMVGGGFARLHIDGRNWRPIAQLEGVVDAWRWSPDGRAILALTRPSSRHAGFPPGKPPRWDPVSLWSINADGSGQRRLAEITGEVRDLTWSADGSRVAFCRVHPGGGADLCVIRADGTGAKVVAGLAEAYGAASWSPDSLHLAFTTGPAPVQARVARRVFANRPLGRVAVASWWACLVLGPLSVWFGLQSLWREGARPAAVVGMLLGALAVAAAGRWLWPFAAMESGALIDRLRPP